MDLFSSKLLFIHFFIIIFVSPFISKLIFKSGDVSYSNDWYEQRVPKSLTGSFSHVFLRVTNTVYILIYFYLLNISSFFYGVLETCRLVLIIVSFHYYFFFRVTSISIYFFFYSVTLSQLFLFPFFQSRVLFFCFLLSQPFHYLCFKATFSLY